MADEKVLVVSREQEATPSVTTRLVNPLAHGQESCVRLHTPGSVPLPQDEQAASM